MQGKDKLFKVISSQKKGTIKVYDEKGNLVMERNNLTKKQVELIELNFLKTVAKKLNNIEIKIHKKNIYDPMVA